MLFVALEKLTALLACTVFMTAGYRLFLTISYLRSNETSPEQAGDHRTRFATVIPAHNEALVVGASIDSVRRAYSGLSDCHVYVVADNCSDATAEIASRHGAQVLIRSSVARGKGWALEWAVQQLDLSRYDAVAFLDADSVVDPDFFREMSHALANGGRVLQGYDGIANPLDSPLTRLISITSLMKNLFYNAAKSKIGLSPHLMGTGMVFSVDVLRRHGWKSHSIVESIEQSFRLIFQGERACFVEAARVYAQEAVTFKQAQSQRQRWASGQAALARIATASILRGVATGRWTLIDAGADLLFPFRYSKLLYCNLVGLLACTALSLQGAWASWLLTTAAFFQAFEFCAALSLLRDRRKVLGSVFLIPAFVVWKARIDLLALMGHRRMDWVRTRRHGEPDRE